LNGVFEFPEVLDENGNFEGFDVVLGNPPYMYNRDLRLREREYYKSKYETADDLYAYFLYEGLKLLKTNGFFSYITPNTYFSLISKEKFRNTLLSFDLQRFTYSGFCFTEAYVETHVFFFQKKQSSSNEIVFVPNPNDYAVFDTLKAHKQLFANNFSQRFFYPTEINLRLYKKIIIPTLELQKQNIEITKGSKKFEAERADYFHKLNVGDITLLGLICKGGVGIVTGNNSRYVASIVQTEDEVKSIGQKFTEIYNRIDDKKASVNDFVTQSKRLYEDAEKIKLQTKQPSFFGKFFNYKHVYRKDVKHFNELSLEEKKNGTKDETWIFYHRGNTEGYKWYVPYKEAIVWSEKSVKELKEGEVTNSRWHGIPYFYSTGFGWIDYFTDKLKTFYVEEGVYSKNTVKMHSVCLLISDKVMVCLLNSKLLTYLIKQFITSTHTLQINDGRLIPIKIPSHEMNKKFEQLFDNIFQIRLLDPEADVTVYEKEIDVLTYDLYDISEEDRAIVDHFFEKNHE